MKPPEMSLMIPSVYQSIGIPWYIALGTVSDCLEVISEKLNRRMKFDAETEESTRRDDGTRKRGKEKAADIMADAVKSASASLLPLSG